MNETLIAFAADTLRGLEATPKFLLPRYFYDEAGSVLFQRIMQMPEYYLYRSELSILERSAVSLAELLGDDVPLEIIEPGAGDGSKTRVLLSAFSGGGRNVRYTSIDISEETNSLLAASLAEDFPELEIRAEHGDYFQILKQVDKESSHKRLILLLGSNIGNYSEQETEHLLEALHSFLEKGDHLLIGFDLKKSPDRILHAYSDPAGITREFNLNHLLRINRELDATFNTQFFEHHATYDPSSGEARSFLVSTERHEVELRQLSKVIEFERWEPIYMEVSRKYDSAMIGSMASQHGFEVIQNFSDRTEDFVDSLWARL